MNKYFIRVWRTKEKKTCAGFDEEMILFLILFIRDISSSQSIGFFTAFVFSFSYSICLTCVALAVSFYGMYSIRSFIEIESLPFMHITTIIKYKHKSSMAISDCKRTWEHHIPDWYGYWIHLCFTRISDIEVVNNIPTLEFELLVNTVLGFDGIYAWKGDFDIIYV